MIQKTIIANAEMNKKHEKMGWFIAVRVPSGKMYAMRNIVDPLKAMRYMYLLSRRENADIDRESLDQVKLSYEIAKVQQHEGQ